MAAAGLAGQYSVLLQAWQLALPGLSQQHATSTAAQPVVGHRATAATSSSSSSSEVCVGALHCLAQIDLPLAVMQQLQLLLVCQEQELLQLCFSNIMPGQQQQQPVAAGAIDDYSRTDQERQEQPVLQGRPEAATAPEPTEGVAVRLPAAAATSHMLCAALTGIDAISTAAVEFFNSSLKCKAQLMVLPRQAQQQEQQHLVECEDWLARQWALEVQHSGDAAGAGFCSAGADHNPAQWMQVAGKLLKCATACDKLLKLL